MNASQRRIATRRNLRSFPVGSDIVMETGKPAKVIGADPAHLILKRRDNRQVSIRVPA